MLGLTWKVEPRIIRTSPRGSAIRSIRDLAYGLLPPGLTELGLVETVLAHCEDFSLRHGIAVEVFADGLDGVDVASPQVGGELGHDLCFALHVPVCHSFQ